MSDIKGIFVDLKTSGGRGTGTDDPIYLGIFGKKGGSEFPLDVYKFDDFEKGNVKYWLGTIWEGGTLPPTKRPRFSEPGKSNDPAKRCIGLEHVEYVYLRKLSTSDDDDAWKMSSAKVVLYGNGEGKRTFQKKEDIWLANEHGHQVWLPEYQS